MKFLVALLIVINTSAFAAPKLELWKDILTGGVSSKGDVDYVWIEKNKGKLDAFIKSYADSKPSSWSDNERKAHYINFYNASMIYNLLRYSEESKISVNSSAFLDILINKISVSGGNIWNGNYKMNIGGTMVNLDEIEHGLIRGKMLKSKSNWYVKKLDPRVHAALNCAAVSCPVLSNTPFLPKSVNEKLEKTFINWLGEEYQFKKQGSGIRINKIIKWYFDDFASFVAPKSWQSCDGKKYNKGTGNYLCHYLDLSVASQKQFKKKKFNELNSKTALYSPFNSISFEYDWHINDKRQMRKLINDMK